MGKYYSNSVTISENDYKVYIEALHEKINEKNVNNIAVISPYGGGKSSLIATYNKIYEPKSISVSLSEFNTDNEKDKNNESLKDESVVLSEKVDEENIDKKEKLFSNEKNIERSILQQILFSEKASNLYKSKIDRIGNGNFLNSLVKASFITILLFLVSMSFWEYFRFNRDLTNKRFLSSSVLFFIVLFIGIIYFFYEKIKLKHIKLKDFEAEFESNNNDFILSKFTDELLYFFSRTKIEILYIEDLDRFDDLSVFVKLREINQMINKSKIVKQKVTFIYCIKDDLFYSELDRAKFFEYILTLIPILNSNNVEDKINELNNELIGQQKLHKQYIHEISYFIDDYRLLKNIFNDYILYWNQLEYDDKPIENKNIKLFSLMIYKNKEPSDFSKLQYGTGNLAELFKKKSIIKSILCDLEKKESEICAKKDNTLKVYLDNEKVIKMAAKQAIIEAGAYNNYLPSSAENFDQTAAFNNTTKYFVRHKNGYYSYCDFEKIKNQYSDFDFLEYFNNIAGTKDKLINEYKESLSNIELEKSKIKTMPLSELVNIYTEKIIGNQPPLITFLISNKYIEENYLDYITDYSDKVLSRSDRLFISCVLSRTEKEFEYSLNNISNVLDAIPIEYFSTEYILNFDLINSLFNNIESKYKSKNEQVFKYILNSKEEKIYKFILKYLVMYGCDSLIKKLIKYKAEKIKQLINDNIDKKIYCDLLYFILSCDKNIIDYYNQDNFLKIKISQINGAEFLNIEKELENSKLKDLNINFKNINNVSNLQLSYILKNNLFELNLENLKNIFMYKKINIGISSLFSLTCKEYIKGSISEAYDAVKEISQFDDESQETIECILNSPDISKEEFLSKLNSKFLYNENFDFNEAELNIIVERNLLIATWKNYNDFYVNYNMNEEKLISLVQKNQEDLNDSLLDNLEIQKVVLNTNRIDISKFTKSFTKKVMFSKNTDAYSSNLIVLYKNGLLEIDTYKGIEKQWELFENIIKDNIVDISKIEDIDYDKTFVLNTLSYSDNEDLKISLIRNFKNDLMLDESFDFTCYEKDINLFDDEFLLYKFKNEELNYSQLNTIVINLIDKNKLKEEDCLFTIFKDYDSVSILNSGGSLKFDIKNDDFKTLLNTLKSYKIIKFISPKNTKKIRDLSLC